MENEGKILVFRKLAISKVVHLEIVKKVASSSIIELNKLQR